MDEGLDSENVRRFIPEDGDAEVEIPTVLAPLIAMRARELGFGCAAEYFAALVERDCQLSAQSASISTAKIPVALQKAMERETLLKLVAHHARGGN